MAKQPAERLAELEERRARLNAEIQRVRAREQQQRRRDETRRKILLGGLLRQMLEDGEINEDLVASRLDQFLTRDSDRRLFDLNCENDSSPEESDVSLE